MACLLKTLVVLQSLFLLCGLQYAILPLRPVTLSAEWNHRALWVWG